MKRATLGVGLGSARAFAGARGRRRDRGGNSLVLSVQMLVESVIHGPNSGLRPVVYRDLPQNSL